MKRKTAALLSFGMVLSMLLGFGVVASAATVNAPATVAVGNSDIDTNVYTEVTNASSNNTNIATVKVEGSPGSYKVHITGVAVGNCNVTYKGYTTSGGWVDYNISVTVTASSAQTTTLPSQNIGVGANYGTASYTNVSGVSTSNSSVATAYAENTGIVRVTGVSAGSANITFNHVEGGVTLTKILPITVGANTTATDSIDLAIGGVFTMQYAEISSANSANSNIAKVETSTLSAGNVQATITGVADGTTTVTVNFKENASSANTSRTITVRVGSAMGGATASNTGTTSTPQFETVNQPKIASSKIPTNSSTEGIYIPKRTVNATNGKTYRVPNIKLEGKTVKASELRWVAEDADIVQVNTKTGTFKCIAKGSTKLFAVDINGKYMNYVTVNVK